MDFRCTQIGKDKAVAVARSLLADFVYDMGQLEGNTLTYAETQSVIYGTSVGGKPVFDVLQIKNISDGWKEVISLVVSDKFEVDERSFVLINSIVSSGENLELGRFRTVSVKIKGTGYEPPEPSALPGLFNEMIYRFRAEDSEILQRGYDLFLDSARNQYFRDGNKRTGLLVMNGFFMASGYTPVTISREQGDEYFPKLIRFYETNEKTEMRNFLAETQYAIEKKIFPDETGQ